MKNLKKSISNGELIVGIYSIASHPTIVEMLGYAGFDFVVIDTEHAACAPSSLELENLIRAAYASDIAPLVRVNQVDQGMIEKALDLGAQGTVIPHVQTKGHAGLAVKASHFPPEGERGCAPPVKASKHGWEPFPEFVRRSNEESLVIPLIEDNRGYDNLDDILTVDGLDAIHFGGFELSLSLGRGGDMSTVNEYMDIVYAKCREAKIPVMDVVWDFERAQMVIKKNCRIIAFSVDLMLAASKYKEVISRINSELRCAV